MKTSMGRTVSVGEELHKLANEDPDQICDEFDITTDDLLRAFHHRIINKLQENYDGDQEDQDEEG